MDEIIIHEDCGLPVELCECDNSPIFYDWENDVFIRNEDIKL